MDKSTMTPPSGNEAMPGPANINLPSDPSPNVLAKTQQEDIEEAAEANN